MMSSGTSVQNFIQGGLSAALASHEAWLARWPAFEPDETLALDSARFEAALQELFRRLHGENYPFPHPLYAGQMLKPPHPAAMIAYFAAMLINPNNHALDGGPATARMEAECIDALASSMGFPTWLGHLTSSGTIANLEALWVARQLHPDRIVVFSDQAHYTHARMCELLKIKYAVMPSHPDGSMNLDGLRPHLKTDRIGTVVATLGTTSLGALDPLAELVKLQEKHGFRIHVDAAYGGYYHLLRYKDPAFYPFDFIGCADSVVIDPHKHGLQPYGCGCVIFRDPEVAALYAHESPYTYYTGAETDRHLGEISLECSRAGAAAAALWLTMRCMPLEDTGMALVLEKTRGAALRFARAIQDSPRFTLYVEPALDIVTYYPNAPDTESISAMSEQVFERAMAHSQSPVYLAKLSVPVEHFMALHPEISPNSDTVTLLRSCLLKPEHAGWVPRLVQTLEAGVQSS